MFRLLAVLLVSTLTSCAQAAKWPRTYSVIKKDPKVESQVQQILASMTLEEKIAQMIQAEIKHVKPEDLKEFPLGSILNGGGSFPYNNKQARISDWVKLADSYYNASSAAGKNIPLIWGTDAVHGHNNVIGATIFPHNIGLGAANNVGLIEDIAKATAKEVLATGIDWIFAPTVAVVRNDRWGRTYEGYSEDPAIVKKYAGAMIKGIQGQGSTIFSEDHLIATAKHFVGDGGTEDGIDQGNNTATEEELIKIHAQGYVTALNAGAQTVMASFNSWQGKKIHGHKYLMTEVLKNQMGFDGFVIGDWNGHGQVPGCRNDSCPQAINAGLDMFMAPQDWKALYYNTLGQAKSGEIPLERINDAVTRILRVKVRYGLMKLGVPSARKHAGYAKLVGAKEHRAIARQAVRESLVLLKNKNKILPLSKDANILVAGSGANNIGKQSGGWSITWQGTGNQNSDFPGATSVFDGIKKALSSKGNATLNVNGEFIKKPDVAVVVFGENPYAEGQGDIQNLYYGARFAGDLGLIKKLKAKGIPVVSVFITGRPLWVNPEINASDAFVVAWLPGTEGAGIADVIIGGDYDFSGKLSFSWPANANQVVLNTGDQNYQPLFPYGFGLSYQQNDTLGDNLPENPFPNGDQPGSGDTLSIFKGRPLAPFKAYVGDDSNRAQPIAAGIGVSSNNAVKAIAIDKDVQEDARQITFMGTELASYFLQSTFALNITDYLKTNGALVFDVRIDKLAKADVLFKVNQVKFPMNKFINSPPLKKWKTVKIPLSCFSDRGVDFRTMDVPFSIETAGSFKLSIANISVMRKGQKQMRCPL